MCSAPKGFGKSNYGIITSIEYRRMFGMYCNDCHHKWIFTGKALNGMQVKDNLHECCPICKSNNTSQKAKFKVNEHLAYDNSDLNEMIHNKPKFSPIIADEAVRFMMGEDWNISESKDMKKLFAQMRTKGLIIIANIPNFSWIDKKYRNDMGTFWLRIIRKGKAVILTPDLSETKDAWHLDEFQKLLGHYSWFTSEEELDKRLEYLLKKHPCVFDVISIPKVPDNIYSEYQKTRDDKAFEQKKTNTIQIDNKIIPKIVFY
jgi:hypothetical protein